MPIFSTRYLKTPLQPQPNKILQKITLLVFRVFPNKKPPMSPPSNSNRLNMFNIIYHIRILIPLIQMEVVIFCTKKAFSIARVGEEFAALFRFHHTKISQYLNQFYNRQMKGTILCQMKRIDRNIKGQIKRISTLITLKSKLFSKLRQFRGDKI